MVTVTAVATLLSISCTWVSFQRARVFSQKIAAVTPSRPSPRAFRRKALRYAGVRLDTTALEFVCIGGLQFLFHDLKHAGYVSCGKTKAGQGLDPGSQRPVILDWIGGIAHRPWLASQSVP